MVIVDTLNIVGSTTLEFGEFVKTQNTQQNTVCCARARAWSNKCHLKTHIVNNRITENVFVPKDLFSKLNFNYLS